jgi:hypothetical protein
MRVVSRRPPISETGVSRLWRLSSIWSIWSARLLHIILMSWSLRHSPCQEVYYKKQLFAVQRNEGAEVE